MRSPEPHAEKTAAGTIRLISWNIHGGIGRTRRADRERTVAEIARLSPDILVLQEVDGRRALGRPAEAFAYFRHALAEAFPDTRDNPDRHLVEARTGAETGNLLWSRVPIVRQRVFDLPGPDIERRTVIDASLDLGGTQLRVLGTHMALLPTTRLRQARKIVDEIDPKAEEAVQRTVLIGDLNEWWGKGWVDRTISTILPTAIKPRSWPERIAIAALDRAYLSKDIEIVEAFADSAAGPASDHRPLVLDLRV